MRTLLFAALLLLAAPALAGAQTAADSAGIRAAALDYIEGWYTGDAERMERALHPDLAKRIVGRAGLDHMGAAQLVEGARRGGGRSTPTERQRTDTHIQDVFGNAASVRIDAGDWVDFLHVARIDGEWKIVNVLWELRPRAP
jgi:hypothetical protein